MLNVGKAEPIIVVVTISYPRLVCRIPVERDNYTHYVKITAVNSLGEAGPESKLHSFVVRHSYSRHQQNTRKIGQDLDIAMVFKHFMRLNL